MTGENVAGQRVSFVYAVHHPYQLNAGFCPGANVKSLPPEDLYFSPNSRDALRQAATDCYAPATGVFLSWLHAGCKCAFSISGLFVEQLERWEPDLLDRFIEIAAHPGSEFLAETYYHSIAGLFPDTEEFSEQVELHIRLIKDVFHVTPVVFDNTEFALNPETASVLQDHGLSAIYTMENERIRPGIDPNYVYSYNGLPVLVKNCTLSDDLAIRFSQADWNQYPLAPDRFAEWIALSRGDSVNIGLDCSIFSGTDGRLNFLEMLPAALAARGTVTVTPSEIASAIPGRALSADNTVSRMEQEKGISSWEINMMQHSALMAIRRAGDLVDDLNLWRYLQASDHFQRMSMKSGACGKPYRYSTHKETHDYFTLYMRILSHYEESCASRARSEGAARALMCVPPEKAFHFSTPLRYAGYSAHSLYEFEGLLGFVTRAVFAFPRGGNAFSRCFRDNPLSFKVNTSISCFGCPGCRHVRGDAARFSPRRPRPGVRGGPGAWRAAWIVA